jgi:hypothetical protein
MLPFIGNSAGRLTVSISVSSIDRFIGIKNNINNNSNNSFGNASVVNHIRKHLNIGQYLVLISHSKEILESAGNIYKILICLLRVFAE